MIKDYIKEHYILRHCSYCGKKLEIMEHKCKNCTQDFLTQENYDNIYKKVILYIRYHFDMKIEDELKIVLVDNRYIPIFRRSNVLFCDQMLREDIATAMLFQQIVLYYLKQNKKDIKKRYRKDISYWYELYFMYQMQQNDYVNIRRIQLCNLRKLFEKLVNEYLFDEIKEEEMLKKYSRNKDAGDNRNNDANNQGKMVDSKSYA